MRNVVHASFTITRTWKASPSAVFAAFSDQERKDQWFGRAEGMERLGRSFDFRVGGKETSSGRWLKTGMVSHFDCIYQDIVAPSATAAGRIITSYVMHLDERKISVSQQCIEIVPDGAGTRLVLTEYGDYLDGYDDAGSREHGTNWLMDNLGKTLER